MGKIELIKELELDGVLKAKGLKKAFLKIDRKDFVPAGLREQAYENYPLPIGFGQSISQPYTVAFMLNLLEVRKGDRILEIGAGSGWQTALLAELAGPKGAVFAMEIIPQLAELARQNADQYGFVRQGTAEIIIRDGSLGLLGQAPYDRIVAAASAGAVPQAWLEQLKPGGRLVAPVNDAIVSVDKTLSGDTRFTSYQGFAFVTLVED
jgi:protein-L-isoaspartate(D-aspartate) O-methyltransferase